MALPAEKTKRHGGTAKEMVRLALIRSLLTELEDLPGDSPGYNDNHDNHDNNRKGKLSPL